MYSRDNFKRPKKVGGQKAAKRPQSKVTRSSARENNSEASGSSIRNWLHQEFTACSDFTLREIIVEVQPNAKFSVFIAFIDGFVDKALLNQDVIQPILFRLQRKDLQGPLLETLKKTIIENCILEEINDNQQIIQAILSGNAIIFVDGEFSALKADVRSSVGRSVEEPSTETTLRDSREGFVENLQTNMILLRKRLKTSNLKFEPMTLGIHTKTEIRICYLKEVANESIIAEVRSRLQKIHTDQILSSGDLEHFIQDSAIPLFPLVGNSERPENVAAKLLEGRVAVFCDGTPVVLTVPYLLVESLQTADDYHAIPVYASLMRLIRFLAILISTVLPGFYVALITFHQPVIPFNLIMTITASREGIPFSVFFETLILGVTFEFLREAGIRLPKPIGPTIGIVGAIVLGEAAVRAGIASAPTVILTALTAICGLIVAPLIQALTVIRLIIIGAANFMGLLGIAQVGTAVLIYLASLRSFGVPYLTPFTPLHIKDLHDSIILAPAWAMVLQPKIFTGGKKSKPTDGNKQVS
jgi:spore germination protein KA